MAGDVARYLGPFGRATLLLSAAFLLAGIAWPQAAAALLRLLIGALIVGYVLSRSYGALLPDHRGQDLTSPFDGDVAPPAPRPEPTRLRELTRRLAAARGPAESTPIPWYIRQRIAAEAAGRLERRHRLRLDEAGDAGAIRALVSDPTWRVINDGRPGPPGPGRPARPGRSRPPRPGPHVPMAELSRILDDLEAL